MDKKVTKPTQDVNCTFVIDRNEDGSIRIELWKFNRSKSEEYVKQYVTYLVYSNFIEVGKYRTMGDLNLSKDKIELVYSVCKKLRPKSDDDVWTENIEKSIKFK